MSLFDRFRKKSQSSPQQEPSPSPVTATSDELHAENLDTSLRGEVSTLYDRSVNPLHAIRAMLHDTDGNLTKDARKIADIWLGVNDLLDRDGIENVLRSQLVSVRDVLAKTIENSGPEPKTFVTNYREGTRHINEMRFLQSYQPKLVDGVGVMQLEAFHNMLAEIEHERANNPGSPAQDISDETLASLYKLRDNWDDPSKLK